MHPSINSWLFSASNRLKQCFCLPLISSPSINRQRHSSAPPTISSHLLDCTFCLLLLHPFLIDCSGAAILILYAEKTHGYVRCGPNNPLSGSPIHNLNPPISINCAPGYDAWRCLMLFESFSYSGTNPLFITRCTKAL